MGLFTNIGIGKATGVGCDMGCITGLGGGGLLLGGGPPLATAGLEFDFFLPLRRLSLPSESLEG